jgi:hypothetical protein
MATPKKFTVPTGVVQGRIPNTRDFGITEAIQNVFQPGVKNPGIQQAFRNFVNAPWPTNNANDAISRQLNIPARPSGMTGSAPVSALVSSAPPEQRAYEAEKSRVAQLTEQDPLFKKYQVAELSKQYNAAKGDEREKIGMQIWAQTNPQLAAKLRPGATGYSDVATAFQNLSPLKGVMPQYSAQTSFTAPTGGIGTMPNVEQTYRTSIPQGIFPGMDTSSVTTAVAPGAFSQSLSTDITNYLTDPLKAYAPTEKIDQTQVALLKQAYNQRFK